MKTADIGGAVAILAAGYIIGRDVDRNDFPTSDILFVVILVAVGYYLAVYLS